MALALVLMTVGCGPTAMSVKLSDSGQVITGHKVVQELHNGRSVVEFSTTERVPGGKFWAVVPNEVIRGELATVSFHWHGDDDDRRFDNDPASLANRGWRVEQGNPVIVLFRPHSAEKRHRRSFRELNTQMAAVKYIHEVWNVNQLCLGGHSSGGTIAMAVAQELPHLMPSLRVRSVRIASSLLAVKNSYRKQWRQDPPPRRAYSQYDPIDYVRKLSPEIPVLIVYDFDDRVMEPNGFMPYVDKARELGLDVHLEEVDVHPPHSTEWVLGQELKKSKNERYRCS